MQREIGSNFWVDPAQDVVPVRSFDPACMSIHGSDLAATSSGRGALALILETIAQRFPGQEKRALLPSFTCHTVIAPFLAADYSIEYLPVDEDLRTQPAHLEAAIRRTGPTVVLLHRYFGFDTLPGAAQVVREAERQGVAVIEDRTQCLYSGIAPLPSSFCMGSLRKWAGLPDGGFAVCCDGRLSMHPDGYDKDLEQAKLAASYAKYRYLFENIGEKSAFLDLYRRAEGILDQETAVYAISPAAVGIQTSLDLSALSRHRRENYQILLDGMRGCQWLRPIFPELPEDAVPLYLPVAVRGDRGDFQRYLADASIYAPIVWPRPDMLPPVCKEAETFYQQLLCIPVDQRYGPDDMGRIINTIKMFKGE